MPDVKEKTEVGEPAAAAKSKLPSNLAPLLTKVAIFGVIALVAIIAAYVLTLKVLKPMLASDAPTTEQAAPAKPEPAKVEESSEHGGGHGEEGGESSGANDFFTIESIVVNPAETGGTRYLSCSVSFEVAKEDLTVFKEKQVKIKDILITILSSKTVDELADIKLRNDMRKQILAVVNRFVAPSKASAVYLTDFVLQ